MALKDEERKQDIYDSIKDIEEVIVKYSKELAVAADKAAVSGNWDDVRNLNKLIGKSLKTKQRLGDTLWKLEIPLHNSNVKVTVEEFDEYVYLSSIKVSPGYKNRGHGSKALQKVIDFAASRKKPLLAFVTGELGGDVERLKVWYKRFGFYEEHNLINAEYNYNFRKDW
ncbi:GNAT family N-acetyltransferase [Bacillus mycoides]|uniref:GNAT family N-acetyltransferase n=1 Tax=Bacillus mycoides TaxID=1405 RepID=UPI003A8045F2